MSVFKKTGDVWETPIGKAAKKLGFQKVDIDKANEYRIGFEFYGRK